MSRICWRPSCAAAQSGVIPQFVERQLTLLEQKGTGPLSRLRVHSIASSIDDDFAARRIDGIAAWILGRNMFGPSPAASRRRAALERSRLYQWSR